MPLFFWKKSYEIKVPEIDMQHRRLVGLINELSDAMMVKQGHKSIQRVLAGLVDYIQVHFTTEEEAMQERKYPGLHEHRQEHLNLTSQVLDFKERYSLDNDLDSQEVLNFLCDWLKTHIIVSDKDFGTFIRRDEMGLE